MLDGYLPVLVFLVIGLAFGIFPVLAGVLLGPKKPSKEKYSQFECGFNSFEDSRMRFDVRYYLVAILFILFDLEVAFVFPWAVVQSQLGWFGFIAMSIFLFLLVVGFIFEWKKGALEWE
ncbi:NADH ubiquinone oxidoreductase chain A [hydrothermal vent metagenome]|uniref:NADH ubiquinone oxidoreductase chain A n=1 Tax=hydrothermal vent metagenome TaxID=652676 RepID=A0A1W1CC12_9ZZZZ